MRKTKGFQDGDPQISQLTPIKSRKQEAENRKAEGRQQEGRRTKQRFLILFTAYCLLPSA